MLIVGSVVSGIFVLLLLGTAGVGIGTASSLQARFAAVDLADDEHRGRALSTVVWAITIGAVAGPNLIQPGAVVGQAVGLPPIAGPLRHFCRRTGAACALLLTGLRPDPLLFARQLAADAAGVAGPGRPDDPASAAPLPPGRGGGVRGGRGSRRPPRGAEPSAADCGPPAIHRPPSWRLPPSSAPMP